VAHDHRGKWNGNTIVFEPLHFAVAGMKITEILSVGFPTAWFVLTVRDVLNHSRRE
jgi:hypothetical protein